MDVPPAAAAGGRRRLAPRPVRLQVWWELLVLCEVGGEVLRRASGEEGVKLSLERQEAEDPRRCGNKLVRESTEFLEVPICLILGLFSIRLSCLEASGKQQLREVNQELGLGQTGE